MGGTSSYIAQAQSDFNTWVDDTRKNPVRTGVDAASLGTMSTLERQHDTEKANRKRMQDTKEATDQLKIDEFNEQIANEKSTDAAIKKRAADRARQRQRQSEFGGRKGTILTSPLGIAGGASGGGKTLLGG